MDNDMLNVLANAKGSGVQLVRFVNTCTPQPHTNNNAPEHPMEVYLARLELAPPVRKLRGRAELRRRVVVQHRHFLRLLKSAGPRLGVFRARQLGHQRGRRNFLHMKESMDWRQTVVVVL
jgi:hypothetical protein